MFASRVIQRVAARVPKAKFSHAAPVRDGVFREKSFNETWFQDKGAYPVMSVIIFGVVACTSFGMFYLTSSPDCKLAPGQSRSRMFRADLSDEYIKEDVDVCK